jgi:hypothetical protein
MSIENILKSAGLKEKYVCKDPDFYFWDKSFHQTYTEPSYYTSKDKEMDEVYRMHQSVMLHFETGIRFVMFTSENYLGDEVSYSLCRPFIITTDGRKLNLNDVDLDNKVFFTDQGKIPFEMVLRD